MIGFKKNQLKTQDIVILGILMGMELILNQINLGNQLIQFNLVFLVTAVISYCYGMVWSVSIAAVLDIVGTLIQGVPYFPGFTISAIVGALIYSLFFYNHRITWIRVILAQVLISLFVNAFLNTWWVNILYYTPFTALFPMRLVKQLITTPIQIILIYLLLNSSLLKRLKNPTK
ncbi:folate family ECF transporter S component [Lentilactobacillus laojiaonis]|uniref:folate family ECF transporter S component n=1 Tax=Lentilactobacillus laojiaonis TaxID=2883998 RepID=UPI001D0B14EF|nr:folate family ECF transporter S component [Lentilactobacillus laojiaonis]UDM32711.1 folate family ECF transporter S component [Lentilactobacillus laojiaonis]